MATLDQKKPIQDSFSQNQLTNQLAFYKSTNWEIFLLAKQLNYQTGIPRCAILLIEEKGSPGHETSFCDALQLIVSGFPDISEDIFGYISNDRFLIFKSVSPDGAADLERSEVRHYVSRLQELLEHLFGYRFTAYIGSTYTSLSRMHESFDEVQFLSSSPIVRESEAADIIMIDHHLGEYLIHRLPEDYKYAVLRNYDHSVGKASRNHETIRALIANNYNTTRTAEAMNVHRNTLFQRMNRLSEDAGLDPVHNSEDRTALHAYTMIRSNPVIWNACINIRPNNIIHLGFDYFSRLLEERTEGRFRLNVNIVSASGDYNPLFRAVCDHEIDCAAVNTSILGSIFDNWPDILEYPFLFESEQEAQFLMDHSILHELQAFLNNSGARLAALWSMGWREFSSVEPLIAPNNLYGRNIRTLFSSENAERFFRSLGANLYHMHYSDIAQAMSSGIIDIQDNPYSNVNDMRFYQHHHYITQLKAFYDSNAVLCSEASWNGLPADFRTVFLDCLHETTQWLVTTSMRKNDSAFRELLRQGMKSVRPDPATMNVWRKTAAKSFAVPSNPRIHEIVMKERSLYRAGVRS